MYRIESNSGHIGFTKVWGFLNHFPMSYQTIRLVNITQFMMLLIMMAYASQGEGVLWYVHTYVGSGHFWDSKFWFQSFWGFSEKWIFWGILGGHHKIGLYSGVISMHFRVFSKGQGTEWGCFWGSLKFQIFFGVLEIPDIFGGMNSRCWARAYVWRKNESTPWDMHEKVLMRVCKFRLLVIYHKTSFLVRKQHGSRQYIPGNIVPSWDNSVQTRYRILRYP